jgi:ADP-ribose pyrophosphatase YjhB (NUDIX family)
VLARRIVTRRCRSGERECASSLAAHQFDVRAAALLLDGERVLLHRLDGDTSWALPGGRVHLGEAADQVRREMREELGVAVAVTRLLWIVESFFEHRGRTHHELGFYCTSTGFRDADAASWVERG